MLLSVLQENLHRALARTSRVVATKPQLPILAHVLLRAEEGRLVVAATGTETTEVVWTGAKTEKEGGLCVPSRLFTELVGSLPQEAVRLEEKEGQLCVSCGNTSATIPGVSATEFPPVVPEEGPAGTSTEKGALAQGLGLALFAAATDEGRPILTGIKIVQKEKGAQFVATDGYRLSVVQSQASLPRGTDVVVPGRGIAEFLRVCQEEKEEKEVRLSFGVDGQTTLVVGDTRVVARQIGGEYPSFEKIIPARHNTSAAVDTQALARAVKSAAIFARDNANIVRLRVDKTTLTVSANAPQVGENSVGVDAQIEGEGGEIAFNSRFLLDLFSNFPEEELVFEMTGSLNPGLFRPAKDKNFFHVIMPVRVQA